jgi:hypothetical protein
VFAAFVFGALLASLIDRPDNNFVAVVRIVLVLLAAYCAAHIIGVYVIAPRRRRSSSKDADAIEYEDELVYEDEAPKKR